MKSGAEVKTRPVVRTELWPHTIANEEDGENISSEDISLAKFLSCYTHIMVNCSKVSEKMGRSVFLHAISTVLEFLPWSEARIFHNISMLKIEQGRIKWSTDFSVLAGQFLDKKCRLNLRSENYSGVTRSSSSSNYGYDFENYNFSCNKQA